MFEYDVDLLTFFRIVDCGDIPDRSRQQHQVARVHLSLSDGVPGRRGQGRLVRRRSLGAYLRARALSDFHKNGHIGYLHVDCHLDAAPDWAGNAFTNCSGPSRALDLPNCNARNMVHMGCGNGLNPKDWHDFFVDNEVRLIPMQELVARGKVIAIARVKKRE